MNPYGFERLVYLGTDSAVAGGATATENPADDGGSATGTNMETGLPSGSPASGELQLDQSNPYPTYAPEDFPDGP